jgi:hypothetical protein
MAITNLALLTGPTISVTGGTTQTFAPDGTKVNRGISVSDISVDSILARPSVVAKNTPGVLQPDKTWSKDRRELKYVIPEVLADGSIDFAFIEVAVVKSPLRGATTIAALKEKGVQLVNDADFSNFWSTGAIL